MSVPPAEPENAAALHALTVALAEKDEKIEGARGDFFSVFCDSFTLSHFRLQHSR